MMDKNIFLSIDEYAYSRRLPEPTLKPALAYAMVFNEMLRHSDFLTMTAFTMGASTLDFTPRPRAQHHRAGLQALWRALRRHDSGCRHRQLAPAGADVSGRPDQPQVSAGSPTYPLDYCRA